VSLKSELIQLIYVIFSPGYILLTSTRSVETTWESIELSFWIFRSVVLFELCRVPAYVKQKITGTSWDAMRDSFKSIVSVLYGDWHEYLWDSLDLYDQKTFQSIRSKEASDAELRASLDLLSQFLYKKSGWKVIVLIDEYEAPNNRAYEFDFFEDVRPLYPSRLYSRLTTLIQANEFFRLWCTPSSLEGSQGL